MATTCPECRVSMESLEQGGVVFDVCHTCHGLWFDSGLLPRFAGTPLDLVPAGAAEERLRLRFCPRCARQRLEPMDVRDAVDLGLDQCGRCQGLFLEAGKLPRIERLKARRARLAALEDARLRGAIAEEKRKRDASAQPNRGVELESGSASSGNVLTLLLDLPREEGASLETTPYTVYSLAGVIFLVWLWQLVVPQDVWLSLASVPSDVLAGRHRYTLVTDMFVHAGWFHVLGNLYFFLVFADNVEDRVGHLPFLGWYLLWGVISGMISVALCPPESAGIPQLGASGAISGAMGAYVVLFPRNRIVARLFGVLAWGVVIKLPAWIYLGFWMVLQFFYATRGDPGVAWWAHLGGFAAGAAVGAAYRASDG
jgi:rhomboid family protein